MNKKILFSALLGILLLPSFAFAAPTIGGMVLAAENTTLLIASGVVVILWVVTGLLFVMAQGDPAKLKQAKTALFGAIAGTVVVIVAGSAIAIVSQAFGL